MSLKISKGATPHPQKVAIYGVEGIGKTTLAASFPDPLFVDTEGGTDAYDVARTQPPQSWTELKGILADVAAERPCTTLVLDTADWAERLLCAELCAKNKWDSMESLGYGKCWQYALEEFGRMLDLLTDVRDAGMNVVVTAHAMVSKFDQPDEAASYDRWTMKMNKKNAALLKEWADALLFVNYKTVVEMVGEGFSAKGKARGAKRTIFTTHHAAWDAKNRWGLPDEVPLGYEALAPHIPGPARPDAPERAAGAAPGPEEEAHDGQGGLPAFWGPALSLMEADGVSVEEVMAVAASRGHFSPDTPPESYDPEYIEGFVVPNWPGIREVVMDMRERVPFE